MTSGREARQFYLLSVHYIIWSLAMSLASGFVGAYLLRLGFSIAATISMYALLLTARFSMRAFVLPIVRRLGMRKAMLLGASIAACQFLPLIHADQPLWLCAWVVIVSVGECLYWPICHAANAVSGGRGRRGRQIALRQTANTVISVIAPIVGGTVLTQAGPAAEFGLATIFCVLSMTPLLWIGNIDLGTIPTLRQSWKIADAVGLCAFAADGWMCAGLAFAWPIILFSTLGSSYDALGHASSAAGVASALTGLACGTAIDRGYRRKLSHGVMAGLLAGVALRVAAGWVPWMAIAANALGAAVSGAYYPVLMSVVYDRAKRSGSAYVFHLSAEAGWDAGAVAGCLATAAVAWSGVPATLAILPSMLGILLIHRCVQAESKAIATSVAATSRLPAVKGGSVTDEEILPQVA
jgi:MFS transporter, DHA1 family, inner membrane transport protein